MIRFGGVNLKVYKKILSILLLVVLSFNTVIALEARSAKIEYIGKVTSSTGSTVGRFKVNGQWAFCVDHAKTSPPSNTSYDSGSIYNNESIRAILYYGYGGIGNEIGTSNDAWVATTLALDSVMNNNDSAYRRKIPGYSILMDHAQKKDAPSTDASFSKSSVTSSVSGDRQVSETITFNADYRNSITLAVQSGTTIVVDGKSYTNGNVTINGGQSFYITAPLDYSNNVVYSNIKPSLKIYQSILYMPTSSKYQRLGQGMEQDPPPIQNLSVEFKARQRNITVLHKNRHDGSILLQENDKKNIGSNYTYYPKNPLYKDGTTFIPESTNSKSGTVPNQDLTIEFWYNAQQNITIQHIDNRDGSIISQENEKKNRGEQYSYSPKNDLKKGDYTYRPISNQVQSGTVGNSDITIKFYYDVPLIKAGLKKIQIYTEQADKGLPVKVEIDKKYIYDENIADMSNSKIKLGLYDNSNNEMINIFLMCSCLGFIMIQRNKLAIHGSAVVVNNKAIVLTGGRGAGKSTLSTALRLKGYKFLADDVAAITLGDKINIEYGFPYQKLCEDTAINLGYDVNEYISFISNTEEKYIVPAYDEFVYKAKELGAIFEIISDSYVSEVIIEEIK